MTVKLYCFGESGNAYKAALSLELANIAWSPVFVDFFGGETRQPEFRDLNQLGEVPVMVADDLVLTQSGVIQQWVVEQSGKLGSDDKMEILRWQFWDNHKMSALAGMTRYLMNFHPKDKRPQEVIAFNKARLKTSLTTLETALTDKKWLVGDSVTIADISCCSYLYYPEPFGFDRSQWPAIDAWLSEISQLPGWKHPYDLMPGSPADRA